MLEWGLGWGITHGGINIRIKIRESKEESR